MLAVGATTNVSAFGSLWIAQFVVLDRVLFGGGPAVVPAVASEPSEPSPAA